MNRSTPSVSGDSLTKGDRTRVAVLAKALALSSQVGLEALSLGTLASAAGLSKSGLFAHFDSKLDLQLQVMKYARDLFIDVCIAPALREPRGLPRLQALFDNWIVWENHEAMPGGCVFISYARELGQQPGPLRDRLLEYESDWMGTIQRAVSICIEEGHLRDDADPKQVAYEIHSTALGYHHFSQLLDHPDTESISLRAFERIIGTRQSDNPTTS